MVASAAGSSFFSSPAVMNRLNNFVCILIILSIYFSVYVLASLSVLNCSIVSIFRTLLTVLSCKANKNNFLTFSAS